MKRKKKKKKKKTEKKMKLSSSSPLVFVLQLALLLIFSSHKVLSSSESPLPQCHPDDSVALLRFKTSFSISATPTRCGPDFRIASWNESTNCCVWDGITCDVATGHVIGVDVFCGGLHGTISSNSSLFFLRHLQSLDLRANDFKGSPIVPEFGHFKNMTRLDLSYSNFSGHVPPEISHLSKLIFLGIGQWEKEYNITIGEATFKALSRNLTNLESLYLINIDMSSVPAVSLMNLTSSLTSLDLYSCQVSGELPQNLHFPKLKGLYLPGNNLRGHIPSSFFNLEVLDLSHNYFIGQIPEFYGNSRANISSYSSNLSSLYLSDNLINGSIPFWIFRLPNLQILNLRNNLLTGEIHDFYSTSLSVLDLSHNKLNGIIPRSLFHHVKLWSLNLSSNNLIGNIELGISKTSKLSVLDLSFNHLSLSYNNSVNYTIDHDLSKLFLSSCNITEFPPFLRSLKRLEILDLSQNQIRGSAPKWLWEVSKDSLIYLDLSQNKLTHMDSIPWNNLGFLDLRSNWLQGPPPLVLNPQLRVFLVSKNRLRGEIPTSFCNMTYLMVLDLSYNNLSGKIPPCLGNFSDKLLALDLRMNKLRGTIPLAFAKGNSLTTLNLNGNQFEGFLPRSLLNCKNLQVLDVGNNKINGPFPQWLESLGELQVLILRSNRLYGPIHDPKVRFPFHKLRIIDISSNEFTGLLPSKYFENFEAMIDVRLDGLKYMRKCSICDGREHYQDSVALVLKGFEYELEKILTVLTTIDFSRNRFTGDIPQSIGKLHSLKGLNFSRNKLTGVIPKSLGNLTNLEWLDLSSNELTGNIPGQLASNLNQLQIMNLSNNKLEGPIPRGPQFDTFKEDSFGGNSGLCGFPLSKPCTEDVVPKEEGDDEEHAKGMSIDWKVVMMGYGSGLVIGISVGYMVFFSRRFDVWIIKRARGKPRQMKNARSRVGRRSNIAFN